MGRTVARYQLESSLETYSRISRKGGIRVFFFEEDPEPENGPSRFILTHGYRKQTDKTPPQEIDHFFHLRDQYYRHKFDAE